MSYAKREGVVRDVKGPFAVSYALINYPSGNLVIMRRYAAIGLLLVGCAAALLYQTRRLGLTVDETSHFAAAYAYWQGQDVLEPPDAPPLTRAICGWAPRLLKAPQLRDTNGWKERDAYLIGAEILDRPNIRARRLLFYTRLPFLLFPLLIVFLLWHWGRQLLGNRSRSALPSAARSSQRSLATACWSIPTCPPPLAPCGGPTRPGDTGARRMRGACCS